MKFNTFGKALYFLESRIEKRQEDTSEAKQKVGSEMMGSF